jgi:hypothetical protein
MPVLRRPSFMSRGTGQPLFAWTGNHPNRTFTLHGLNDREVG